MTAKSLTQSVAGSTTTRLFTQSLKLTMDGPATAEVGQKVTFTFQVTNASQEPMQNVVFKDHFDGGLAHSELQESPVKFSLESLGVGETVEKSLTFIVKEPGLRSHTLSVTTNEGQSASATGKIQVSAEVAYEVKSRLEVEKSGPRKAAVGDTVLYLIEIANTGKKPLHQIEIIDEYSKELKPITATDGFDPSEMDQRRLSWYVEMLPVGAKRQFQVKCTCVGRGKAENKVKVKAADGLALEDTAITNVGISSQAEAVAGSVAPASGTWKIQVADLKDAVQINDQTTYHIDVLNDRGKSDRDVKIVITLSEGLQFIGANRTQLQVSTDKRTIEYGPLREVRAREKLPTIRLRAKGTKAGQQTLTVVVTSRAEPKGKTNSETTTVYAQPE